MHRNFGLSRILGILVRGIRSNRGAADERACPGGRGVPYLEKVLGIKTARPPTHLELAVLKWCHQDSNRGHTDFQSDALPTELWHPVFNVLTEGLSRLCGAKLALICGLCKFFRQYF